VAHKARAQATDADSCETRNSSTRSNGLREFSFRVEWLREQRHSITRTAQMCGRIGSATVIERSLFGSNDGENVKTIGCPFRFEHARESWGAFGRRKYPSNHPI
jgi:hypothetical protein